MEECMAWVSQTLDSGAVCCWWLYRECGTPPTCLVLLIVWWDDFDLLFEVVFRALCGTMF